MRKKKKKILINREALRCIMERISNGYNSDHLHNAMKQKMDLVAYKLYQELGLSKVEDVSLTYEG